MKNILKPYKTFLLVHFLNFSKLEELKKYIKEKALEGFLAF